MFLLLSVGHGTLRVRAPLRYQAGDRQNPVIHALDAFGAYANWAENKRKKTFTAKPFGFNLIQAARKRASPLIDNTVKWPLCGTQRSPSLARSTNESQAQIDVKQNESENTMISPAGPK